MAEIFEKMEKGLYRTLNHIVIPLKKGYGTLGPEEFGARELWGQGTLGPGNFRARDFWG